MLQKAQLSPRSQNSTLSGKNSTPRDLKSTARCTKIQSPRHKIKRMRNRNNSQLLKIESQKPYLTPRAPKSFTRQPPPTSGGPNCFQKPELDSQETQTRPPEATGQRLKIESQKPKIDYKRPTVDPQTPTIDSQRHTIKFKRPIFKLSSLSSPLKAKIDSKRSQFGAQTPNIRSQRPNIDSQRQNMDTHGPKNLVIATINAFDFSDKIYALISMIKIKNALKLTMGAEVRGKINVSQTSFT